MAKYRYAGPGPDISDTGEITRPGDERDFGTEPAWGPWELTAEPPEPEPEPPVITPAPSPLTPADAPKEF